MSRPITIITGQFGDVASEDLFTKMSSIGYAGLELACGTDHFDVQLCLNDENYFQAKTAQLKRHNLQCWALSNHCVGQAVLDRIDQRNLDVLPERLRDKDPEVVWKNCAQEMIDTARAAAKIGAKIVTGFTGSSIWPFLYSFPPVPQYSEPEAENLSSPYYKPQPTKVLNASGVLVPRVKPYYADVVLQYQKQGKDPMSIDWIRKGFELLAERWIPILDEYEKLGVKFALEVHPTEIAFDLWSAETALYALNLHPAFGFNFDPSHLLWQQVDPVRFIRVFSDRIYHVHMKDVALQLDGENGLLGSHIPFGDPRRGWEFRSLGHGNVKFEEIIRALNDIEYDGPLSVEWEDQRMDRWHGAQESYDFVKKLDFERNVDVVFDAQFAK
ncbi:MAG: sugar phosphate isomerase/epimerase [Planctomycetia bacterium]|nr:sugar phosphate isomerase/epimerase [Planctomycetia bacterium]